MLYLPSFLKDVNQLFIVPHGAVNESLVDGFQKKKAGIMYIGRFDSSRGQS